MTIPDEIKSLILDFMADGVKISEISKRLKVSMRSIYRISRSIKVSTNISHRQKITDLRKSCIKRGFNAVRRSGLLVTSRRVANKIPMNLCRRTIQRYMKNLNFKYKPVSRKIILTKEHKLQRVEKVRKWIIDKVDPDLIIFTDECRFTLDGNDSLYSWQSQNKINLPKRPFKGGSVMIWGGISKCGEIFIRRIHGKLDSQKYCEMMENDIIPMLNKRIRTYIFQQDNATCHVSKLTKQMFERNHVILLEFPPKSPDLSPIENLWGILKQRLYNGRVFTNTDEIWHKINEEVTKIQQEERCLISNLWNNYLGKMCDVLCKNGEIIK